MDWEEGGGRRRGGNCFKRETVGCHHASDGNRAFGKTTCLSASQHALPKVHVNLLARKEHTGSVHYLIPLAWLLFGWLFGLGWEGLGWEGTGEGGIGGRGRLLG